MLPPSSGACAALCASLPLSILLSLSPFPSLHCCIPLVLSARASRRCSMFAHVFRWLDSAQPSGACLADFLMSRYCHLTLSPSVSLLLFPRPSHATPIWVGAGPMLAEYGRLRGGFGRARATVGRMRRPCLVEVFPMLADSGPMLADSGPMLAEFGSWLILEKCWLEGEHHRVVHRHEDGPTATARPAEAQATSTACGPRARGPAHPRSTKALGGWQGQEQKRRRPRALDARAGAACIEPRHGATARQHDR